MLLLLNLNSLFTNLWNCVEYFFGECLLASCKWLYFYHQSSVYFLSRDIWSDSRAIRLEAMTPQQKPKREREIVCCVFFPSGLFSSLLSKWTGVWSWLLHTRCGDGDEEREKWKTRQMKNNTSVILFNAFRLSQFSRIYLLRASISKTKSCNSIPINLVLHSCLLYLLNCSVIQ